ncbi:tetratricopeptide repeat protein [Allopontixanthobacter sp.]|uniref:tetratricopeptide repeat protein n=1 Tax=Allopontixanthobacter sp. TaxID=2906452 RepID=UPI002AB9132A|nr:tetratricopeptide repeat protein [Allopontixanthobacter sp.]MDZ4306597.1 tetratricopeptide repeat protein [Allopontixanthobacter sp.]
MALIPKNSSKNSLVTPEEKKAQREAAAEDVLLREVDEAVRQDQLSNFAANYGKPLIAAIVLGLAGFGGYLYWQSQQEAAMERDSEALVAALDQIEAGNLDSGSSALDPLIAGSNPGAQAASTLLKAGVALEQGNAREAGQLFAAVAADEDAPPALRDIATIRGVATSYDSLKPADIIARLKPLAVPGNPFFGSAGELVAMAYLDQGKEKEAGALFAAISRDEAVPEGLRSRARQMAGLYGVDAIEDVDKVLEELGSQQDAPVPGAQ